MAKLNETFVNNALKYRNQGPSKFRTWFYGYDAKDVAWCAIFVSYVANETGILGKIVKKCAGAGDIPREGVKANWGKWYEDGTRPQVGDIILFNPTYPGPDKYFSSHVGIVYKVDSKNVYTVEGNANNSNDTSTVATRYYAFSDPKINGYYRPNWSSVNNGNTGPQNPSKPPSKPPVAKPDVTYRVRAGGKWYPPVKNLDDYAGVVGKPITDVAIKFSKGTCEYKVHVKGGKWLPPVTGYNINDYNNGYAGNGKVIDAIEIVYKTPSDIAKSLGKLKAKYRVSPLKCNYYSYQYDKEKTKGQDGYAGSFGKSIDRLQITLSN